MEVNPTPLTQERDRLFREVWLLFMYHDLESVLLIIFRCLSGINLLHVEKKESVFRQDLPPTAGTLVYFLKVSFAL